MAQQITINRTKTLLGVAFIAVAVVAFFAGVQTQKVRSRAAAAGPSQYGQNGGFAGGGAARGGFRRRGTIGTVSSINGNTLVVKTQSGVSTNVSLANNPTIITSTGTTGSASDIHTGDSVVVRGATGSDGTVTAQQVRVNPSMNGQQQNSAPANPDGATPSGA